MFENGLLGNKHELKRKAIKVRQPCCSHIRLKLSRISHDIFCQEIILEFLFKFTTFLLTYYKSFYLVSCLISADLSEISNYIVSYLISADLSKKSKLHSNGQTSADLTEINLRSF